MKVYRLTAPSLDGLARFEEPEPVPGPGQVLIRIRAVSLNYKELFFVRGPEQHGLPLPRPTIPLSDAAGEITAVGPGVKSFRPGDRVAPIVMQNWLDGVIPADSARHSLGYGIDGVLCEYRSLDADGVVRIPATYSFAEGATLPIAAVTAWNAIRHVTAGESVLVLGTGGVSVFALQFAKARGATVFLTSSDDRKLARGRDLGADHTLNYRAVDGWPERVRDLTAGRGVDHVVETVGGRSVERSVAAVAIGGRIHLIGHLDFERADMNEITMKAVTVQGIRVGPKSLFEDMVQFINHTPITPVIDSVYPFDQAADAYRHLESGRHFGKIIININ